ncbi:Maf domain-containing protein [Cephalotus follicularis]|uniref:Maf domain-containing protein n=1 Tax=Cephalotus follicularis TaxID=3775 RepID=A0A1Q3BGV0_CEPFO|nr:Maf domain-containing protein [Cephalotus follicularis]
MEANTSPFKIILGSSSIARRQILAEMGYEFSVMTADIDEKCTRKEKPEELVMALAEAKADAIIAKLQTIDSQDGGDEATILVAADTTSSQERLPFSDYIKEAEPTLLVTSDQVVVYEGVVREKPSSDEEARQFIKGYSGGHAATVGSVLITNLKSGFRKGEWDRVEIYFHDIPDEVIEKLIKEGIVLNVAGGLIIEHPLILPYIKDVIGTTDSVMGLPKALTEKLIKEAL